MPNEPFTVAQPETASAVCYHHLEAMQRKHSETRHDHRAKILRLDELVKCVAELKRQGKTVVFTNGCFDLLHPGHTRYLTEARALGDALIVAVNSDRSVRALKGPGRPAVPEAERAEVLAALRSVNYVTVFDELTPRSVINLLLPQVLVKGADWGPNAIVGREEVEAAGGRVVSIPVVEGYSTSAMIEKIRRIPAAEAKSHLLREA